MILIELLAGSGYTTQQATVIKILIIPYLCYKQTTSLKHHYIYYTLIHYTSYLIINWLPFCWKLRSSTTTNTYVHTLVLGSLRVLKFTVLLKLYTQPFKLKDLITQYSHLMNNIQLCCAFVYACVCMAMRSHAYMSPRGSDYEMFNTYMWYTTTHC